MVLFFPSYSGKQRYLAGISSTATANAHKNRHASARREVHAGGDEAGTSSTAAAPRYGSNSSISAGPPPAAAAAATAAAAVLGVVVLVGGARERGRATTTAASADASNSASDNSTSASNAADTKDADTGLGAAGGYTGVRRRCRACVSASDDEGPPAKPRHGRR